ncbi:protein-export chaperone SecB [Candidatus Pantoea edessiphila]|uniref:Protein-export protein SecB n=1 Tax=Candidatus Pantoea edessiphila TaxID=2044610 RepID=A0A2P5T2D6_9GAMM|nr:protein-export chaperone SecB [Candidatus Pantoea edessiphila]PPI88710.1 protein-export chaperone SecB [Candidatus Pantoea edessiphila]
MSNYNINEIKFQINRIYVKDISFEAANTPKIFHKDWNSNFKLDVYTSSYQLSSKLFEVVLGLTVTASMDKDIAFICEVKQAGIFNTNSIHDSQIIYFLGVYCPTILFPYGSECISNLVTRGTFPQINLAPINFDDLFHKQSKGTLKKDN